MQKRNKVELLAPAGDLERLKFALDYGADACYIGGKIFGLRAATKNFSVEEMYEAADYAHQKNKRLYLVLNAIPHNEDIDVLESYLETIRDIPFDAFIVSDPGVLTILKEKIPSAEIHISTQANNTNYMSAKFWHSQGAKRIILARELSLDEIAEFVDKTESIDVEYEVFVHGAMCISYSGRCLISNYMTGRDANRGDCAQSCRWEYALVEKTRDGEYFPIEEDSSGSYFFNSKDLCALEILDKIIETGVSSLKVEGRNKSVYYVASIIRAYRHAIDSYYENGEFDFELIYSEIKQVSHRDFTLGFFTEKADDKAQLYGSRSYIRESIYIGLAEEYLKDKSLVKVTQKNKFYVGDEVEFIGPDFFSHKFIVEKMYDENFLEIENCPHPNQTIYLKCDREIKKGNILRKKI